MLPERADPFKGAINEEVVYTSKRKVLYGIKCLPLYGLWALVHCWLWVAPPRIWKARFANVRHRRSRSLALFTRPCSTGSTAG